MISYLKQSSRIYKNLTDDQTNQFLKQFKERRGYLFSSPVNWKNLSVNTGRYFKLM